MASANSRSWGRGLASWKPAAAWTSKPAASRAGPVENIRSTASSPSSTTCPRRVLGRRSAGMQPLEPAQLGFDLLGLGSRRHDQGVLDRHGVLVDAGGLDGQQPSAVGLRWVQADRQPDAVVGRDRPRPTASGPRPPGPPARRRPQRGGHPGRKGPLRRSPFGCWHEARRPERPSGRRRPGRRRPPPQPGPTGSPRQPGRPSATPKQHRACGSPGRAGAHARGGRAPSGPGGGPTPASHRRNPVVAARTTGTMWPWATSSVPHRATSPIQRRLGREPRRRLGRPRHPTSQPRVCDRGAERASAAARPGTETAEWRSQPMPEASAFFEQRVEVLRRALGPGPAGPHHDPAFAPGRLQQGRSRFEAVRRTVRSRLSVGLSSARLSAHLAALRAGWRAARARRSCPTPPGATLRRAVPARR